ncbi:hypothetical protein STEG23_022207, partial [Scotinomys teguina]
FEAFPSSSVEIHSGKDSEAVSLKKQDQLRGYRAVAGYAGCISNEDAAPSSGTNSLAALGVGHRAIGVVSLSMAIQQRLCANLKVSPIAANTMYFRYRIQRNQAGSDLKNLLPGNSFTVLEGVLQAAKRAGENNQ